MKLYATQSFALESSDSEIRQNFFNTVQYLEFCQGERVVSVEDKRLEAEDRSDPSLLILLLVLWGGPGPRIHEAATGGRLSAAFGGQAEAGGRQQLELVQLNSHQPL